MNNYYKILQVDKDASPEIIKVAYKLLVKKYHPDLKEGKEKIEAEEKIKIINDAYDILSNPTKKAEYDQTLISDSISVEQYQSVLNENQNLKRELNYYKKNNNNYNNNNYYNRANYNQTQYTNMYYDDTQNNKTNNVNNYVFDFNYKKNIIKEKSKSILAIVITLVFVFIIYNIPIIHDYISNIFSGGFLFIVMFILFFYFYFLSHKD